MDITAEQKAAIDSNIKTIVSASAGSGKTFVMIKKLVAAIEDGVDLDSILAVTFTKKAAAQMKEKLRTAVIERMENCEPEVRAKLKIQLSKISSSSISTIHSFCAKLLRTYFYCVGIDGTFDIISSDDPQAQDFQSRALDGLFEKYYAEDNRDFKLLLSCYRRKRSDSFLKYLILSAYEKLRITARYKTLLKEVEGVYTEEGFNGIVQGLNEIAKRKYLSLKKQVSDFERDFITSNQTYYKMLDEMRENLENAARSGIFAPQLPLTSIRKPTDKTDEEKLAGEIFKKFKDKLVKKYSKVAEGIEDFETEKQYFLKSGKIAIAFSHVLIDFDEQYTAVKREENKLDYNDLEHLTLEILDDGEVLREINSKYSRVFVDEYQDVNPVQEEIISRVGGETLFLVGDVKQAIYGFRGSKSLFFAEKYHSFEGGNGNALRLPNNFRSSDKVIDFVNSLFSEIMTEESCGFDYSNGSMMLGGGGYPEDYGSAQIHIFGKDEEQAGELEVYSVKESGQAVRHTRQGLAVLEIVERELKSRHYDLKSGKEVDTQAGDICILTRKNNKGAAEIVRALTDAGYSVSGAQESNVCNRPEVRQMIDILSYIDNAEQDIPLSTALLSPLGGFSCDELASIRIAAKGTKKLSFRDCCKKYSQRFNNNISKKLEEFYLRMENLRSLAEVFSAAEIIDKILEDTGLEADYCAGGGEKLKNLRRFAAEGAGLGVCAFLQKLKDGGYEISAPAAASSDSIKIMTMHASKGLEFPIVIIADICAEYRGREGSELPFDEQFGFAHNLYDNENMLTRPTVLRLLATERAKREELKNEYNIFYVACTRAMCRLHLMAEEQVAFDPLDAAIKAESYAQMFDMSKFSVERMDIGEDFEKSEKTMLISSPDEDLQNRIEKRFIQEYALANSINLPVKSSASAILRLSEEDNFFKTYELFSSEGETGTERGTAYHRFLELCDFSIKDEAGISAELDKFVVDGRICAGQRELLDVSDLAEILNMPVFDELDGARLYREQEFLCRLPANEILDTAASDGVLVQGAIDLLAETKGGYRIIDYKYSHKSDEQLIASYSRQLALYKKAVAVIMRVDESSIKTAILNIFHKRQILL